MIIASFGFLAFSLVTILAYNLRPGVSWRSWVLLLADLCFLSTFAHTPAVFLPLAAFLGWGFLGIRLVRTRPGGARYLWVCVGTLLLFIWLKKYSFLPAMSFLPFVYTTLGLSYIFFRVVQLIIETNDRTLDGEIGLIPYLNYTLNFTTLISGPIQRYSDFASQHLAPVRPPLTLIDMGLGLERIVIGFFKVNVLGLVFSTLQAQAIARLLPGQSLWERTYIGALVVAIYPIYLYFNFSGYTDIVIGIARFLRIRLPENFKRPFSAPNFLEFWNRWHITLSNWLKNYVYNPLLFASMRRFSSEALEPFLGVFAFFVTFFLIGLWHGQTSVFLFYGILLGFGVSINKLYQLEMAKRLGKKRYKALSANETYRAACRGLTFTFFTFSLLWFWSNWRDIGATINVMGITAYLLMWFLIFVCATIALALWEWIRGLALSVSIAEQPIVLTRYVRTIWATALIVITIAFMELLSMPAPDIVYKTF